MISKSFRQAVRLLVCLLPLWTAACQRQVVETRPTIPLVREILSEKTGPRADLLREREPDPAADIAIIGSELACDQLAEQFAFRDLQDNVNARMTPDGLPDFAGETFDCIVDADAYPEVLAAVGAEELRRRTVLRVLAALDTAVHISPYDLEGLASKPSSKIVVLADPFLAEFGGFDVDTLVRSTDCRIPVVSPIGMMIDRAFRQGGRSDLSVGILCSQQFDSTGIYERIFAREASSRGLRGVSCVVSAVERRDSVLHTFLREYLAAGHTKPLDVILVDDLSVDLDPLKTELAEIVSVMNESSMTLGRLIPRNFFFLGAFEEVSSYCYQFLRDNNLFTHNIAKPQVSQYRPVPRPESEDDSIILIPGSYVQN